MHALRELLWAHQMGLAQEPCDDASAPNGPDTA